MFCQAGIDIFYERMGMLTTQDGHVEHVRQFDIGRKLRVAFQQGRVFDPLERRAQYPSFLCRRFWGSACFWLRLSSLFWGY
jgi:hypothetical protein